jgi:DNA-binding GntR family transcriptional regulator
LAERNVRGLYQYLRGQGVDLRVGRQRIGARVARSDEARLLEEPARAALLTMRRTAFNDQGSAVEHGRHVYRASATSSRRRSSAAAEQPNLPLD